MGIYSIPSCIFTGLPVQNLFGDRDAIEYSVIVNGKKHFICLPYYANDWPVNDTFFKENQYIFHGLLYNDNWVEDEKKYLTIDELKNLLETRNYPKTPAQKRENLLLDLFKYQKEDGQVIMCQNPFFLNEIWNKLYFKSLNEFIYYIKVIAAEGLIEVQYPLTAIAKGIESYRITYNGLSYAIKLNEEGEKSNKCFVAMSFKPEMSLTRKIIKNAIIKTGFEPLLVDENNVDSDRTINDEIIVSLKKCRFCVADFTFQSKGVYFESGFAVGQGKKVIYTCQQDDFNSAHFDIKPLQHILYKSLEQLEIELINKIEAWIK